MRYPPSFRRLIEELQKLPGVGPRSAERLAFHLLAAGAKDNEALARSIATIKQSLRRCSGCNNITEADPCEICRDATRNRQILCVVEQPQDVMALEKTGSFRGLYHVLSGHISPLSGIGPDQLNIEQLIRRVGRDRPQEIVLATNSDIEGEATAVYLEKLLRPLNISISRIAYGLPVGGSLDYADELTIKRAMEGRRQFVS